MQPPGNCTPQEHEQLQQKVGDACNNQGARSLYLLEDAICYDRLSIIVEGRLERISPESEKKYKKRAGLGAAADGRS